MGKKTYLGPNDTPLDIDDSDKLNVDGNEVIDERRVPSRFGAAADNDILRRDNVKDVIADEFTEGSVMPVPQSTEDGVLMQAFHSTPLEFGDEADGNQSEIGIINNYTDMVADARVGDAYVEVSSLVPGLTPGREVMIHQTQCFRDPDNRFRYEFIRIKRIEGTRIYFQHGIKHSYVSDAGGNLADTSKAQVITVPNYNVLTLLGHITPKTWDGYTGGIVTFRAKQVSGSSDVEVDGNGFRGVRRIVDSTVVGNDFYTQGEGPLGLWKGTDGIHEGDAEEFHATINIALGYTGNRSAAGNCAGTAQPDDTNRKSAAAYTYKGVTYTNSILPDRLPFGTGGLDVTYQAAADQWNFSNPGKGGGAIAVFVETAVTWSGFARADGTNADPSYASGGGGCVLLHNPGADFAGNIGAAGTITGASLGGDGIVDFGNTDIRSTKGYGQVQAVSDDVHGGDPSAIVTVGAVAAVAPPVAEAADADHALVNRKVDLEYGDASDGNVTISGDETVNQYSDLVADAPAGSYVLKVRNASGFTPGKSIVLHQTQGYRLLDHTNIGAHEEVEIKSVNTTLKTITLLTPLTIGFTSDADGNKSLCTKTQVVQYPQYDTLTLNSPNAIECKDWDGYSGGIVYFKAKSLVGDGLITANQGGFRGGTTPEGEDTGEGWHGLYDRVTSGGFVGGGSYGGGHQTVAGATLAYPDINADRFDRFALGGGGGGGPTGTGGNSGGAIRIAIGDDVFTGTVTANGGNGSGTLYGGGSGGHVLCKIPGASWTSVSAVTITEGTGDEGSGGTGISTVFAPAEQYKLYTEYGVKIVTTEAASDADSLMTRAAIDERIAIQAPVATKLAEWSDVVLYPIDSLIEHVGTIWRADQENEDKEPGVELAYWTDLGATVRSDKVRSEIRVRTSNGFGSSNTTVRRFSVEDVIAGTDISYADDAADGASFTINKGGLYGIAFSDNGDTQSWNYAVTRNGSELSTAPYAITNHADRLLYESGGSEATTHESFLSSSICIQLEAGDIIRAQAENQIAVIPDRAYFSIVRLGDFEGNGSFSRDTGLLRAYRSTAFSVGSGGSDIVFDTVDWDLLGAYNNTTGEWTAPSDIKVTVETVIQNGPAISDVTPHLHVNGSPVFSPVHNTTPANNTVVLRSTLDLTKGDVVNGFVESSVTHNFGSGSAVCFITISEEVAGDAEVTDKGKLVPFTADDLSAGILTVNHGRGEKYLHVDVYDDSGVQQHHIPTMVTPNQLTIDLDLGVGTITGTWYAVIGIGGRSLAEIMAANSKEVLNADYNVLNADAGRTIDMNTSTDKVVNLLGYATEPMEEDDYQWIISREGAGNVTIQAATGVELNGISAGSATISNRYDTVMLRCIDASANKWRLTGAHSGVS